MPIGAARARAVDDIFGLLDEMCLRDNPPREDELNPFAHLKHVPESHPWEFTPKGEMVPFRFLDLAREIRDKIYQYALQSPASGNPYRHDIGMTQKRVYRWGPPSVWCSYFLLSTSRQVYDEAMPHLYTGKLFVFHDHEFIVTWMEQRSMFSRSFIKHIGTSFNENCLYYTQSTYSFRHLEHLMAWGAYVSKNLQLDYLVLEISPERDSEHHWFADNEFHRDIWAKGMCGLIRFNRPAMKDVEHMDRYYNDIKDLDDFEMYYVDEQGKPMNEVSMAFMRAAIGTVDPNAAVSPLLSLPVQLRWRIYELLLLSSHEEMILAEDNSHVVLQKNMDTDSELAHRKAPFHISRHHPQDVHPAILATCRRTREEATPILYTGNRLLEQVKEPLSKAWILAAESRRTAKHTDKIGEKRYLFKDLGAPTDRAADGMVSEQPAQQ